MRQVIALAAILPVLALAAPAASAAGTGKFCLKGAGAEMNCTYADMASCDKAKKGTETCVTNPSSTTGAGSTTSAPASSAPAKKY